MKHKKYIHHTTVELADDQLDQVAGGTAIDFNTRNGMPDPQRPNAANLLMADRLGQIIPGQWNPLGGGANDDNLP